MPIVDSHGLVEAYELSRKMEDDLLPRYEWLVKNTEDRDAAEILNYILVQSRHHAVMFEHALRMGHGYGFSRGPGMMSGGRGYGMRGGYGYGYGQPSAPRVKPLYMAEAKNVMEDYLKSLRNPNLKLGKIKDLGYDFEAEILTTGNALVDKMLIDKNTGYFRSAY